MVCVDRTERAVDARDRQLMLEGVRGEGSVVGFDVQLEVAVKLVFLDEAADSGRVEVVLMLGRLLWLRFYVVVAVKADRTTVFGCELQKIREVVELELHVGVEQGLVALSTAPVYIALAAELNRNLDRLLDLCRREREHIGVRSRTGTAHIARVAEAVGGAPEQLLVILLH